MFKRNLAFYILIVAWTIITIFGIDYLVGSDYTNMYFSMSRNFKVFEKSKDSENSLEFLKDYDDVKVVGVTDDEEVIGVYDPKMFYYVNSSKVIVYGYYRYFSDEDYVDNENVSILSYPVINYMEVSGTTIKRSGIKKYEDEYKTNIINVFDVSSDIFDYDKDIKIAKNLFSIPNKYIRKIYIDSNDEEILKNISYEFFERGFKSKGGASSVFNSIKVAFNGRIYVKHFLINTIFAYILFIFISYIFFKKNSKYYNIKRLSGAKLTDIILRELLPLLIISLPLSLIVFYICVNYLKWIGELSLNINHMYEVLAFLVINIVLVCIFNFIINWILTAKEVR